MIYDAFPGKNVAERYAQTWCGAYLATFKDCVPVVSQW